MKNYRMGWAGMDPYAGGRGSQLGMDEGKVTQFILTPTLSEIKLLNATPLIIRNLLFDPEPNFFTRYYS